jgi:TPR repeat protein
MKQFIRVSYFVPILVMLASVAVAHKMDHGQQAFNLGDYEKAYQIWLSEAEKGDAIAQFNLGNMYYQGKSLQQDYKEAVKWFRLAAEQGETNAQGNLGFMYINGYGVLQNYAEAYAWWVVSTTNGNETSRDNMKRAREKMSPAIIEKGEKLAREILVRIGN